MWETETLKIFDTLQMYYYNAMQNENSMALILYRLYKKKYYTFQFIRFQLTCNIVSSAKSLTRNIIPAIKIYTLLFYVRNK